MADFNIDRETVWDVIIIGSGVGGATVAQNIAQQGLKVLILEKGKRVSAAMDQDERTSPRASRDAELAPEVSRRFRSAPWPAHLFPIPFGPTP